MNVKPLHLDDIWPHLEDGNKRLLRDLNEGITPKKWMELYTMIVNYCTTNKATEGTESAGHKLYLRLKSFLEKHMASILKRGIDRSDDSLLTFYKIEWERFRTGMRYINNIYNYLNRFWVKKCRDDGHEGVYDVYNLALSIWRQDLFDHLKDKIRISLLNLIKKERDGEHIDSSLFHNIVESYISLGNGLVDIYEREFEDALLSETSLYYGYESNEFLINNNVSDYLKKVETRLSEEARRGERYLHSTTLTKLTKACEEALLSAHFNTITPEFQVMLVTDRLDDLSRMYRLLSRITGSLDPLIKTFEAHVFEVGEASIVEIEKDVSLKNPKIYIETLLRVHRKYSKMVNNSFMSDVGFLSSMDKACRRFINDNAITKKEGTTKSSEILAKYCDGLLRKISKNPEEQEIMEILDEVMSIFEYIEDKDVFQTYYSKMLAKRLIHGTSSSEYLEGIMISKLKNSCGFDYTAKLGRMFTDVSLSKNLLENFQKSDKFKNIQIEVNIMVLGSGSWPLQPPISDFSIPKQLAHIEERFTRFYQEDEGHKGRKLNWLHQLSKGELRARFTPKSTYSLQCSTYQMGILLQFNDEESLTVDELQVATQLADNTLNNTLTTLLKTRVLVKESEGGEISKNDRFSVNRSFKNKRTRLSINIPVTEVQRKDNIEEKRVIEEYRRLQIQAAIVRIMKMRKRLQHVQLMTEVITQLQSRFKPKVSAIKKSIDILIEKEYLERDEAKKDYYTYRA